MLVRLGGLLTLTSSGCSVDFGPAHFLPLHPLVTYRPPRSEREREPSVSSSSMSAQDLLRQRYSVTWHPRLLYLIVSDGYMATVMRVPDRPSPASLLKTLLGETNRALEKTSSKLKKSQVNVKAWLDSVSGLNLKGSLDDFNLTVTCEPNTTEPNISEAPDGSRLPLFLQDKQRLGGTKEFLESIQAFLEDESDLDVSPAGPNVEEGGRLEFASSFDTLHALETQNDTLFVDGPNYDKDFVETGRKTPFCRDLGKIQRRLLAAWAFGISLGDAVEHRVHLLGYTLCCMVRFAALLHLIPTSMAHPGEKNIFVHPRLLHHIKTLLSFLPWDSNPSNGSHCLRLMVEFSKRLVRLLLAPLPDSCQTGTCQVSSQSLEKIVFILQLVSDALDHTYSLNREIVWSSEDDPHSQHPNLFNSDLYHVSLPKEEKEKKYSSARQARPVPQRPSSRLLGVWQLVYDFTQQYVEQLKQFKGCDGWEEEEQQLSLIMPQIQTALQATGQGLEEGPALLSHQGEHLFLCGSYVQSAKALRLQLCQESNESFKRNVFRQTRLCLALLYNLLSQYRLREAQELGDYMAQMILFRAGHHGDGWSSITDSLPSTWLPADLHSDAACAVIQTLGRFMTSYFTNQPLYILPPHSVAILPPLHLPHGPSVGRLVPLSQEEVARAVRQQHLSEVWTVDYAQDLLLLGGLLPEAAWAAYNLGDWKTAASLSLAYTSYSSEHIDFTWLRRRELHLPTVLEPQSIFQAELERLLGNKSESLEYTDKDKSIADSLEGEDWDLLEASVQEILKASVMAGVNVMSSPLSSLMDVAKDMCSALPALVPTELYLPSPPLYCPQPSPNTHDLEGTAREFAEVARRHKVSGVIQRLLLLLRSSHCCRPAAQWYISHLRRARHILHKIKRKYSYTSATDKEKTCPEGLLKLITRNGHFRLGPNKDGDLDDDIMHTIMCFRELCALCWMLHVRDQFSIHCRKYQAARQHAKAEQISCDPEVNSACVDALRWACRLLPFSHFLSAEEVLQDTVLSLISDHPPVSMTMDALVRAFPEEDESVRVPLRVKYNSLMERLEHCDVLEEVKGKTKEAARVLIQDKFRQRRKHLVLLQKHVATLELHLWEREEEEEDIGSKHGMAMLRQLSLGTSLSSSTLTVLGLQSMSNLDIATTVSESTFSDLSCGPGIRDKRAKKDKEDTANTAAKNPDAIEETVHTTEAKDKEKHHPMVGTWEFELEDEEYLNFLDLFLSYTLEKGSSDGVESGSELPLLKGFCAELRKRELHSLTFDILTTIHRHQREERHPERTHRGRVLPAFRAGCCYKPAKQAAVPEQQISSTRMDAPLSRASLSFSSDPGKRTVTQGLFGLRQESNVPSGRVKRPGLSLETSPGKNVVTPKSFMSDSSLSVEAVTELQQGLDPKLETQFPELGRLLEWMVRWADRRAWSGRRVKVKKDEEGAADEGVVIRVKASAPAILTSLSLLKHRYAAPTGIDRSSPRLHDPEVKLTVAPVLQPEAGRRRDREGSVDTGYPASAHTPITGLDQNLQRDELPIGSCTAEPEELMFQRTPLHGNGPQRIFDSQQTPSSSQQRCLDDLDVTPEKESRVCDSESLDVSYGSSKDVSASIFSPEGSLKLADLECAKRAEDVSSSSSLWSFPAGHPDGSAPFTDQPKAAVHAEPSETSMVLLHHTDADHPGRQPQSSTAAAAPTATGTPTADPTPLNQPLIASPMRERLGEDLFRLVQHINYMNLSEVLGASFCSVQLAQRSSSAAPTDMMPSQPNVPPLSFAKFVPESNVSSVTTAVPVPPQTLICAPNLRASDPQLGPVPDQQFSNQRLISKSSAAGVNVQEMQPLAIQADIQQRKAMSSVPSSLGLLTTTDPSHVGGAQNGSAPQVSGVKLLKIHHPFSSQDSAPHYPPVQPTPNTQKPETVGYYQHKLKPNYPATIYKKRREERFLAPAKPLVLTSQCHPAPRVSQQQGFPLRPPGFPAQAPAPMQGLRLLQLQHVSPSTLTFPRLSLPSHSRPSVVVAAPVTETPVLKLLRIEPGPKMMLPRAVPSTNMKSLISTGELRRSGIGQQEAERTSRQLLKVDPSGERPHTSSSSTPSKRVKRREEKAEERKTEVTFRPNDSVAPAQEAGDVCVSETLPAEDVTSGQIDAGSSQSLLTGHRLLDKIFLTSAELHAFASTSKQPPECRDAFTNTDPPRPPLLVDRAVSVQASAVTGSPKSEINDDPPRDTDKTLPEPEKILDHCGRQFISVLDLEDVKQQDPLPPRPNPAEQHALSLYPSSPSAAELHALVTSVITCSAAAEPEPSVPLPKNFQKPTAQPEILEEPPPLRRYPQGFRVAESATLKEDAMLDPPDSEICVASKTQSSPPRRASSHFTGWFSTQLTELDTQLAGLQMIADHLEMDFSNSRMLVTRIEKLSSDTETKTSTATKKTVRLSLPLEAETNPCEEQKTIQDEERVVQQDYANPTTTPSLHFSTSDSRAGSSHLHSPPGKKDNFFDMSGMLDEWTDMNLGQTELSDTVELLDELVREGYLPATDWELPTLHTAQRRSMEDQQQTSPIAAFPEDDRRELRTWMRKKQRERHAAYRKHIKNLRERERKPFASSSTGLSANKSQTTIWRIRREKEKSMLLEQYKQRTREACSLAGNVLNSPEAKCSSSQTDRPPPISTLQLTSAPPQGSTSAAESTHNISVNNKTKAESLSGQPAIHLGPQSSEDLLTRREFDRPGDFLSQEMRHDTLHSRTDTPSQRDGYYVGHQSKPGLNITYSPEVFVEREVPRDQARVDEEAVNHSGSHRPQDTEQPNELMELSGEEEDGARGGVSEMDWLDNLSDSASSGLSQIDWTAIERMVATEEP